MRSKSPPGSSTPTWRRTDWRHRAWLVAVAIVLIALAGLYVVEAFAAPNPLVRIVLRTLPVLPVAVWTLWFDRSRPFEHQTEAIRMLARVALLLLVMGVAVALLGVGLNWLYDPNRVI
jgi:uncharacterized integral membrane protein